MTREVSSDAWGSPQAAGDTPSYAFTRMTVLNCPEFGLTWSRPQQKIADEINVTLSIQFVPATSAV